MGKLHDLIQLYNFPIRNSIKRPYGKGAYRSREGGNGQFLPDVKTYNTSSKLASQSITITYKTSRKCLYKVRKGANEWTGCFNLVHRM